LLPSVVVLYNPMLSSCCAARIDVVSGPCSNERDIESDGREKGGVSNDTMPLLFFFNGTISLELFVVLSAVTHGPGVMMLRVPTVGV